MTFDVIGVGAGPANLSLAALLAAEPTRLRLLEQRSEVSWHPGLLLPDASLQVSHLKDLVTPVLPTSPYSFLSFLVQNKQFYRFTAAGYDRPSRVEFDQYLRWVAKQLPSIEYGLRVDEIHHDGVGFSVVAGGQAHRTRSVVLGTGPVPTVPDCAAPHLGTTVFHASEYAYRRPLPHQRVAVVGGGQSSAEVFLDLLGHRCRDVLFVTRRSNLLPLDDSPFANEFFTPHYAVMFHGLDTATRRGLLAEQRLTSDGISTDLLRRIYREMYQSQYSTGQPTVRPLHELVDLRPRSSGWALALRHTGTGEVLEEVVDVVVLATGYHHDLPPYLDPLRDRIRFEDGHPVVGPDFSLDWDGPEESTIHLQNMARHSHGIADPNLSLLAWRSAVIVNSLLGKELYDVSDPFPTITWHEGTTLS
ncbi:lysine N(6)-hydroxylase/L-ornithine N(5)-oxygenase family protein [Umezawaea endophytica]|uniref:L-lysine N6-monooxygenase MbtG n=1 Tax=Umezawaea endophytica TaxID=1654476 RepID=A0A9X3AES5_9PSEU|nr:SidA/IucD/PvdA family monooxygenase [Umezawaea endophytica]MCS7477692.1 SidA/IucD/PvdA family monooxygenase [Umezawaea endophytica]